MCCKKIFIILLFCLTACFAPNYTDLQKKIVTNVTKGKYREAIKFVDENYNKDSVSLLNTLEKATIYYLEKDYKNSIKYFDMAESIADELYTISITDKLKNIMGDALDNYSGRKYELGLIRFYKSLIYYNLYLSTNDISNLRKARSNIINWNSLNGSFTNKDYYKDDLLQKIWGAFIYSENSDSRSKTSLQSAKRALFNYSVYPTYNINHDKFRENFFKLNKNELNELIVETDFSKSIKNYTGVGNLTILLKDGFINNIKIKNIKIPLALSLFGDQSQQFVNFLAALIIFDSGGNPTVDIPLPYVEKPKENQKIVAELYNKKNKKIKEFDLLLVEPLNEILYDDFEKNKAALYSRLISMVSVKYVSAITSAYAIYNNSNNNILPAVIYYNGAKKFVDKTSTPDTRQWSLLPASIYFTSFKVEDGNYVLKIKKGNKYIYKKDITVNGKLFLDI